METDEIHGWKGIAAYLKVTERTAQNWEQERNLPARRRGGRVFALVEELDEWRKEKLESAPLGAASKRQRHHYFYTCVGLLALAIAAGLATWLIFNGSMPRVVEVQVREGRLIAFGEDDDEIWSRTVDSPSPNPILHDADGDGLKEIFLYTDPHPARGKSARLLSFLRNGDLRWELELGRELNIGERNFAHCFVEHHTRWVESTSARYLLVVASHCTWYPTQLLLVEAATGRVEGEYWHPGFIEAIEFIDFDSDPDPEILIGGSNNPGHGPGYPFLAVLDVPFTRRGGEEDPGFFTFVASKPERYILLPRPDAYRVFEPFTSVRRLNRMSPDRIEAQVGSEREPLLYYFDEDLELLDLHPSDGFRMLHDRLARQGYLDHRYTSDELKGWSILKEFSAAPDGNGVQRWHD